MSNNEILIWGWLIGQGIYIAIKIYETENSNVKLTYWDATKIVLLRGLGLIIIAFLALLAIMFMMPEFFKNVMTVDDAGKSPSWAKAIVNWLRVSSVAFGMLAQYIAIWAFGGLKKTTERFINNKTGNE